MKVRATQLGFFGGMRRHPGDEFDLPAGVKPGKWMEPVATDEPVEKKPKGKQVVTDEPATLSEMAAAVPESKLDKALKGE